jgi:transcriptional repressor NrdR
MKCPFCNSARDRVVDTRSARGGKAIRRRRECLDCKKRYTTYEYIESVILTVVKRDKRREPFDRQKLMAGIITACKKRPVSLEKIENMVEEIENELQNLSQSEIDSREVGERVMQKLHDVDEVAYVRFASVYRQFKDVSQFMEELKGLLK